MSAKLGTDLLHFLAVGRLAKTPEGFDETKHAILTSYAIPALSDEKMTDYRTRVKQVMARGAAKLKPKKRICLTADSNEYDMHVLTDLLEEKEDQIIVFFAVTDLDFNKTFSVSKLFEEFKNILYSQCLPNEIMTAQAYGSVHVKCSHLLEDLAKRYAAAQVSGADAKAAQVAASMKNNVAATVDRVAKLDNTQPAEDGATRRKGCGKGAICCGVVTVLVILGVGIPVFLMK